MVVRVVTIADLGLPTNSLAPVELDSYELELALGLAGVEWVNEWWPLTGPPGGWSVTPGRTGPGGLSRPEEVFRAGG